MEYRCRLGTPTGQILEEVHVSDSEAHLRHELEQKGLCVLAMRPRGLLGRVALPARVRRKVPMREFLVFNQELATLLKAGMPLVQSLDILRNRIDHAVFRAVLDGVHDKVRAGTAISDAFAAEGDLFPSAYSASLLAGEKSGSLEEMLTKAAESYEGDVETTVAGLTSILEPIMIVIMGGIVGFVVISILMPMLEMSTIVR